MIKLLFQRLEGIFFLEYMMAIQEIIDCLLNLFRTMIIDTDKNTIIS